MMKILTLPKKKEVILDAEFWEIPHETIERVIVSSLGRKTKKEIRGIFLDKIV